MIPTRVVIAKTESNTPLWLKDGRYVSVWAAGSLRGTAATRIAGVPIKASIRVAEKLHQGDKVNMRL